jgi:hypothetical protein
MNRHSRVDPAVVIGRTLAVCAHPWITWRVSRRSGRAIVVTAYFVAAYLTTLIVLFLSPPVLR